VKANPFDAAYAERQPNILGEADFSDPAKPLTARDSEFR
jgi:hypothetical protein